MKERDLNTATNFDDVYFRDLISSLCYFFFDTIKVSRVVDGKKTIIDIPILPSFAGSENFVKEFFVKKSSCPNFPEYSSIINSIPSGRISMDDGISIDTGMVMNNGIRTKKLESVDSNDFFDEIKTKYARRTIITLNTSVVISIKCTSMVERFKVLQRMLSFYYKTRTFYFSSCGYNKIPCSVSIPDSFKTEKKRQFKFGEESGTYILDINFEIKTYMVLDDERDTMTDDQRNYDPTVNILPKQQ